MALEVQILNRKLVKPSNSTPCQLQNLELSLFDQLAPPLYAHLILYYLDDGEGDKSTNAERCLRLEKSLAETLTKFYPLAGRFVKDDGEIDCSDQGAEYVEARVNGKLSEFLDQGPDTEQLDQFLPWDTPPATGLVTSPLLALQMTTFYCGGLVVGIRISHVIADACTMMTFLNGWAETSRTGFNEALCPNFGHLGSLFPARILPGPKIPPPGKTGAKIVTRKFLFDARKISRLKDKASVSGSMEIYKPSGVVVVVALIWKALMGVALAKNGHLRDSLLAFAINLRGKSALSISDHTLGNFWMSVVVPFMANKATRVDFQELVILLGDSLRDSYAKLANANAEEISSTLINNYRSIVENRHHNGEVDTYICSSWCKFPIYEADFGWGKPSWISSASRSFEAVGLIDAKTEDGIEAWISLKDHDMISFEQDPDVLAFASNQSSQAPIIRATLQFLEASDGTSLFDSVDKHK